MFLSHDGDIPQSMKSGGPAVHIVCAILAAGRASRMGVSKSALALGNATFAERALAATVSYRTVIVTAPNDESIAMAAARFDVRVVVNDAPERGMTHSLRLANAAIGEPVAALAVLLIDTPLVDGDVLARVIAASIHCDIAYPTSPDGRPGHPVVFAARVRPALAELEDGDTLRRLRDDPRFKKTIVPFTDGRPFTDVDTQDDLARIRGLYSPDVTNIASPNE